MKANIYSGKWNSIVKRMACAATICGALLTGAQAQTYRSAFPIPVGTFNASNPTGSTDIGCALVSGLVNTLNSNSTVVDAINVADANLDNYAVLGNQTLLNSLLGLDLTQLLGGCFVQRYYEFNVQLNLPTGMTAVPGGYYAGFVVEFPGLINANVGSNVTVTTLLNGTPKQEGNSSTLGISLLGGKGTVQFQTTAAANGANDFNGLRIRVQSGLLSLSALNAPPRVYYGYANNAAILPVKLTSFGAVNEGKGVRLNWASASEVNASHYELERSTSATGKFEKIGSVKAKGNSTSATNYSLNDNALISSEYFYRLKIVDKDGSTEYSNVASIRNFNAPKFKIYPTLLSKGQNITVSTESSTAKTDIQLTNLQGQVVKNISTTNANIAIETGSLNAGVYVLKLYRNGQLVTTEKVVLQ